MVAHRKTPSRRAYLLPGWYFVVAAVLVLAAAAWLAVVALQPQSDTVADAGEPTPSATTPSPSASATTPSPTPSRTTASPSASPSPTASRTPAVDRGSVGVSVLNGTRTPGLARSTSGRVQALGWTIGTVGNWRGSVPSTTVFYPAGREDEARLLAKDLGIGSVAPSVAGMSTARLTLVVLGPVA